MFFCFSAKKHIKSVESEIMNPKTFRKLTKFDEMPSLEIKLLNDFLAS